MLISIGATHPLMLLRKSTLLRKELLDSWHIGTLHSFSPSYPQIPLQSIYAPLQSCSTSLKMNCSLKIYRINYPNSTILQPILTTLEKKINPQPPLYIQSMAGLDYIIKSTRKLRKLLLLLRDVPPSLS